MANGTTPQIMSVTYDPGTLSLVWAPLTLTDLTGFRVFLKEEGGATTDQDVGPTVYNAVYAETLDINKTYSVAVSTLINGQLGDQSAWLTVITAPPGVSSIVYDIAPKVGLNVRWAPLNDPTVSGYVAVLAETGGPINTKTTSGTDVFFDQSFHVNRSYQVSVRATADFGIVQGPASALFEPILVNASVSALVYDVVPDDALTMRWVPVSDPKVDGYAATLRESGGGPVDTVPTSDTFAVFKDTLDPTKTYDATVRATSNAGIVQGPPSSTFQPIIEAPAVTLLAYDILPSAALTFKWAAVNNPDVTAYLAVLTETGGGETTQTPTGTTAVFDGALDAQKAYQTIVRATADLGIIQGPPSDPLTPIISQVTLNLIDYDGAKTVYTWETSTDPAVTHYLATLATVGSATQSELTDKLTSQFAGALSTTQTSSGFLRGADDHGVVLGPASGAAELITDISSLSELDYDIGALTPSWSIVNQTSVSGYQIDVDDGGSPQSFDAGDTTTKTVAITLDPLKVWSVTVRPTGDKLIGPPATSLTPIVKQAELPNVYYNGTGFPFEWVALADISVTGYQAQFYQDDAKTDDTAVTNPTATFDHVITAGIVYAARVRATGTKLKGPWTNMAPGPFKMDMAITPDGYGRIQNVVINTKTAITYTIDPAGNVTDQTIAVTGP